MAKLTLESKENSFILNGLEFQKGSLTVSHSQNGVSINGNYASLNEITADGNILNTIDDLKTWISTNLFKSGGTGLGNGVQWSDVSQTNTPLSIVQRHANGNIDTGIAEFPENAVPLVQFQQGMNEKADLVNSKVPESQLPSYVDNVQEYLSLASFPETGLDNVIYVSIDTNNVYRWSGTNYVQVAQTISLGETSATAHRGDHGAQAYSHITATNNPHGVTKSQIGLDKVNNTSDAEKPVSSAQFAAIETKENLITPSTINHVYRGNKSWGLLTPASVGLGNVDNTSDANKPITQALLNAFSVKADLLNGKVPTYQLPSYVDNVQEYATLANFPTTGMSNVVYLAINTNKPYRWGGSSYVEISSSGVAIGETENTASRGDMGKVAYDHSQATGNPHGTTKADIGLGSVDNTSDAAKPISTAVQTALNNKQNYPAVNSSIGTRNAAGNQGSVVYTSSPTVSTLPVRNTFGTFQVAEPISGPDVATKNYVDAASPVLISNTVANGVRFKDYSDRREYSFKHSIANHSVPANGQNTVTTTFIFPAGVTMAGADEMYVNVRSNNATIHVNVWDDANRAVRLSFDNNWTGASTTNVSVFVKLVFYK